jgi:hypothetical protein
MDKFVGLANDSGMFYPTGFVVALIPNRAEADAAAAALRDKAFSDVREFTPEEIISHTEMIKANRSFFDRLSIALSESEWPAQVALDHVKLGCYTVMAQANDEADVERARALLNEHQARMTAYWGKWQVAVFTA